MSFIHRIWNAIILFSISDRETLEVALNKDTKLQEVQARNTADWKRQTTMHHEKLVEEHLRTKAYLIAEKDGFRQDPAVYWEEAQRV